MIANDVDNLASDGRGGEKHIRKIYKQAVARFGIDHTHDFLCQTWRGKNWVGACDCTLSERQVTSKKTRVGVRGRCDADIPHEAHIFAFGVTDNEGNQVLQECPGQYSECSNCDERLCMSCVFREVHDVCKNDCPSCC